MARLEADAGGRTCGPPWTTATPRGAAHACASAAPRHPHRSRRPAGARPPPAGCHEARRSSAPCGDVGRSAAQQTRVGRRERPAAAATARAQAGCEAFPVHPRRPHAAGAPGQSRPRLAVGPRARPARHAPALASAAVPPGLAAKIALRGGSTEAQSAGRDNRADPRDGRRQPPLGRRAHPRRAAQAGHPGRQVDRAAVHARRPAAAAHGPALGDVPAQSRGRHLGSPSPTCFSGPCTPSSWSRWGRGGWCTSG